MRNLLNSSRRPSVNEPLHQVQFNPTSSHHTIIRYTGSRSGSASCSDPKPILLLTSNRKINMPTATQIYRQLEDLSQRHDRLRKKFPDFFELAGYLSTRESRIQGVVFDGHLDDNFFNVSFCGHTCRRAFKSDQMVNFRRASTVLRQISFIFRPSDSFPCRNHRRYP